MIYSRLFINNLFTIMDFSQCLHKQVLSSNAFDWFLFKNSPAKFKIDHLSYSIQYTSQINPALFGLRCADLEIKIALITPIFLKMINHSLNWALTWAKNSRKSINWWIKWQSTIMEWLLKGYILITEALDLFIAIDNIHFRADSSLGILLA